MAEPTGALPKDTPLDERLGELVKDLSNCHFADQDHCARNFDRQKAYWLLRGFLDDDAALDAAHDVKDDADEVRAKAAAAAEAKAAVEAGTAPSITPVPEPVYPIGTEAAPATPAPAVVPAAATAAALSGEPAPASTTSGPLTVDVKPGEPVN